MRKILSIIIGKITLKIGVLIGLILKKRPSVTPGSIAKKIDKNILGKFKLPKTVICVTGSSGKGSTTKLINNILNANNISCIYNYNDSNIDLAIISLLLEYCTLSGKIKKDALVLEVDERYAKYIFPYINPNYVVITNITRDQPPRQGHFDIVSGEIKKALTNDMHLILNSDDPYLQTFVDKNKVTYYSLDKTKYSYKNTNYNNLNLVYCPNCNKKLDYLYYHIESTGKFSCSCGFSNKNPDYSITNVNYNKKCITIDNLDINLKSNMLYDFYNTIAAYTVCMKLNVKSKDIVSYINTLNKENTNIYNYKKNLITVLSCKNENSSTFNQAIYYVNRFKEKKNIIIGWNEISRRYNHFDISWLYDIDFESLKNIDTIICVGTNKYDIAVRIKHANIKCKIKVIDELELATTFIKKQKLDTYAILNFDYVLPFNKFMKEGLE